MICKKCKKEIEDDSIFCRFCGKRFSEIPNSRPKTLKRANSTGSVTKLSGRRTKPWCARVTIRNNDGEKKRVVVGCYEKRSDALAELDKIITAGGLPEFFNITVSEVHDKWMESHYSSIGVDGRTNYDAAWKHFPDSIKNMKMAEIKTYHIQAILNAVKEKGLSLSSIEKVRQLASQLCQWAESNDVIAKNYSKFVEINADDPEKTEPFTVPELNKIWAYYQNTKDKTAGAIILLCHVGMRLDEFLSLKRTDYYNGCFHGGNKTEKGRDRAIPIPDSMMPIIEDLLAVPGEYILSNTRGGKYDAHNWRKRNYYKTLKAIGFDDELIEHRKPHSCRHTYATMCSEAKMDDKALQDILGHEDIATTKNIYTHTNEEYLKKAAKKLFFIDESI